MFFRHRVRYAPHVHHHRLTFFIDDGHVFFLRRINGTGDKFGFVEFSVLFAKVEKDFVAAFTFVNFHGGNLLF
jgi:hypothetical protein